MANKWFQDGNPASFKIQVLYNEIPVFVKTRLIDTPFRFASYEDAMTVGQEVFNGIQYRIVGSSDKPHWQSTPLERSSPDKLKNKPWYDIYGVAPAIYKQATQPVQRKQPQELQVLQGLQKLQKLKPVQATEGVKQRQVKQVRQPGQVRQVRQARQAQA